MNAVSAFALARKAGVTVVLDGRDLRLTALREPPPDVLEALKAAKSDIVALLRADQERREEVFAAAARIVFELDERGFSAMVWTDGSLLLRDFWRPSKPRSPPAPLASEFWDNADAIARWLESRGARR